MTKEEAEAFMARCPKPDAVRKLMEGLEADGVLEKMDTMWHADAGEIINLVAVWRALEPKP